MLGRGVIRIRILAYHGISLHEILIKYTRQALYQKDQADTKGTRSRSISLAIGWDAP